MDEKIEKTEVTPKSPEVVKDVSPISELTGLFREMVTDRNALKDRIEQMDHEIKTYQEAAKRGFYMPDAKGNLTVENDPSGIFSGWDLARQGKRLMDKLVHPAYQMTEAKRDLMAKYMLLAIKGGGRYPDPRAFDEYRRLFGQNATVKTAIGDSGNVFPVPDELEPEILAFERESSVVLQYARVWDMGSDKKSIPTETTVVDTATGNTTAESEPVVTEVEITAEELSAYLTVRNATLSDSVSDIVSWLTEALAEAAAMDIDQAAFSGDGTSTYMYCSGLLSAACGYSVVMGTSSAAFSMLTWQNLNDMIGKLNGKRKNGARFFMHGETLGRIRALKDTTDRPIFFDGYIGTGQPSLILSYPFSEVMVMPSTTGASTAFVSFGNLRYLAIGRRVGSTALEVDPYGLFTTNRTRFKLYQRWGLKIGLAKGFVRLLTSA